MRRVALAIVGTVGGLVMLLGFKTHSTSTAATAQAVPDAPSGAGDATSGASSPSPSAPSSPSATAGAATSPTAGTSTKTVTGDAADTRYGPVQVQITVANGVLTNVSATEYPERTPRDEQINSFAIPQLNSEALAAKSAKIDMVSGATYTSDGYVTSLQSALDKAGL